jgi:hypothetical protein
VANTGIMIIITDPGPQGSLRDRFCHRGPRQRQTDPAGRVANLHTRAFTAAERLIGPGAREREIKIATAGCARTQDRVQACQCHGISGILRLGGGATPRVGMSLWLPRHPTWDADSEEEEEEEEIY